MKKCRNYAKACVGTCRNACTLKKERSANNIVHITMANGDELTYYVTENVDTDKIVQDPNVYKAKITYPKGGSWESVVV